MNYSREQMRAYMARRRDRIRSELLAVLGGKCVWCSSTEDLQFDHKDPRSKLFDIASGLDRPRAQLLAEVKKCQLLCGPDHREKTQGDEPNPSRARGERSAKSALTSAEVLEIRTARGVSQQQLADAFGVSKTAIQNIVARKTWQHI